MSYYQLSSGTKLYYEIHGDPNGKETIAFLDAITGSGKFGSTWLTCLGLTVTKIGLLFKSMSIANDIAGV